MRALAVGVLVIALGLGACASDSDRGKKKVEIGGNGPTPTGSAEPDRLLDKAPAKPEKPKMANTDEGAIAYAEYVVDVLYYSYGQSDSKPFAELADPRGCLGCENDIGGIDSFGKLVAVLTSPVELTNVRVTARNKPYRAVSMNRKVSGFGMINPDQPNEYAQRLEGIDGPLVVNMRWLEQEWVLSSFKSPER